MLLLAKFSKECRGGWAVDVDLEQEGAPYNISNKNTEGVKQFYEVVPGKYGNPIIIAEPDLAFEAPESVAAPTGEISPDFQQSTDGRDRADQAAPGDHARDRHTRHRRAPPGVRSAAPARRPSR